MEFLRRADRVGRNTRPRCQDRRVHRRGTPKGRDWYIGAMTNWTPRDLEIDLSFLPAGNLPMESYQDGVNANRCERLQAGEEPCDKTTKLKITLAKEAVGRPEFIPDGRHSTANYRCS